MKAIVLGATGAVGKALVTDLANNSSYEEVRAITRRDFKFDTQSPKLNQKVINFDALESHKGDLQGYDTIFVTMGTTRAAAGGAENFIKIDQDLTVEATKAAITPGLKQHVLYCSAGGASEASPFLYPKSKGQTERRLRELGASSTTIFRPGFLELQQQREKPRLAENIFGSVISKFRYVGIKSMSASVTEVAKAMRIVAENNYTSVQDPVTNAMILALCQA